jgi:hypothetical protein
LRGGCLVTLQPVTDMGSGAGSNLTHDKIRQQGGLPDCYLRGSAFNIPTGSWSMSTLDRPMCLTCKHRMRLARISPGQRGFEECTFECSTCHAQKRIAALVDPHKTNAAGWLASELRPPR